MPDPDPSYVAPKPDPQVAPGRPPRRAHKQAHSEVDGPWARYEAEARRLEASLKDACRSIREAMRQVGESTKGICAR
jgi:hypothetical protein